ncbi:hypothetical protein C4577_00150 [Candidatus Parcubacteria bacterium]|nr:MAG: hypothetical protein C4577_00150 [Candidatus Parcubacteria bacterium]
MRNQTVEYLVSTINKSDKLSEKEKEVLTKRARGDTLEKIGKRYRITAERVRQIEEAAIIKFMKKIYQLLLFEKS